ncbi:MAG: VIT1/CCC1 transporter family protein [Parachlamydiaceae bacterium]|nr:VIT1/CCC1 transporter family protein [Parachlamydiaceae bacterium]
MENSGPEKSPSHFAGKDAINHVAEAKARGMLSSLEPHGVEPSGKISSAADSLRECSLILLIVWQLLTPFVIDIKLHLYYLALFGFSLLVWKAGRSAWLGWSRLERLHRVLAEEKWEIEHHRQQERDELRVLYAAKGFEGKLLEDVLDVLMADGDRLLKVMVEEELGLSLETSEHPLMQSLGAIAGSLFATLAVLFGLFVYPEKGPIIAAVLCIGVGSLLTAWHAKNRLIPALVWNLGLLTLSYGSFYFLSEYFL